MPKKGCALADTALEAATNPAAPPRPPAECRVYCAATHLSYVAQSSVQAKAIH